jgi:hypothetical protein
MESDFFKDMDELVHDAFVAKAENGEIKRSELLFTDCVVSYLVGHIVNVAIYFDDEARIVAIKVYDIMTNRMLSAKFETVQAARAQTFPKHLLGIGGMLAKFADEIEQILRELGFVFARVLVHSRRPSSPTLLPMGEGSQHLPLLLGQGSQQPLPLSLGEGSQHLPLSLGEGSQHPPLSQWERGLGGERVRG